ncbi:Cdc7p-Dbf4p kinase complex regulatory subunit [Malassezia caprae]|uniref:Cdc7p-Dbf4p kinase complex regulatory subunit n=1 Tax=Malassezia caprae TaxID=1381934 RepID=A0AAF0IUB9_9BASI|nr:Cdc7p-Dbf4p kinase complex regulatory subunit [Malassezia caprae]
MSLGPQRQIPRLPLRNKNVFPEAGASQALLGEKQSQLQRDEGGVLGTPPRKRAVPLDGVHARNVPEPASSKRMRTHRAAMDSEARRAPGATVAARPTTTRIDKTTRVSHEEQYQRAQQKAQAQREWKVAFGRAFPKFVFYLDEMDEGLKKTLSSQIGQLGARVDEFFSRGVTHVVSTRSIPPSRDDRERVTKEPRRSQPDPITPPRILRPTPPPSAPLHSDRNPLDEIAQPLPASDLLCKAQHFGMKIWRLEKLQNILQLLLADDGPAAMGPERQGLSEMLLQEKLHGTTERDPHALRSDVHYFSKHSYYLLVTDATGEHRPVMIAEYDRNAPTEAHGKPAPWPVLHGDVEGRGLFVWVDPKERRRLAQQAPSAPSMHHSLRRTASLNLAGALRGPVAAPVGSATPTLMASDNSLVLASTVASTTSTQVTSQHAGALGPHPDKRLLDMHWRLHTPVDAATRPVEGAPGSVVQHMLHLAEGGAEMPLRRSRSTGSVARGASAVARVREKRPGHCENCRCRYDDFDEHTRSRRHRKFALDESNFVAIDELLQRVQREPLYSASQWVDYTEAPAADSVLDDTAPYPTQT